MSVLNETFVSLETTLMTAIAIINTMSCVCICTT